MAQGDYEGWDYKQVEVTEVGKDGEIIKKVQWEFHRNVTHDGNAQTISLPTARFSSIGFQINRIRQLWNDTTSKDFEIRVYGGLENQYDLIRKYTSDTTQSDIMPGGEFFIYLKTSKIDFVYANTTNGKTVDITIQLEEL